MPLARKTTTPAALLADLTLGVGENLGHVVAMMRGIAADPRVPQSAKLEASAAVAYLVSGRGRIPGFIPLAGRLDALALAAFAFRRLLASAGEPVLRSHWRGSQRALEGLLALTGALASPGGRWRRMAVAGTALSFIRDELAGGPQRVRRSKPGLGRIVDGEVLASREDRS